MKDALATLQKLPEKCASVENGVAVFIRRGARASGPAHMPSSQVDQWNQNQGIEPHVRLAMEIGLSMGWDADGADPDEHQPGSTGPFTYTYAAELLVTVTVTSHGEKQASGLVKEKLDGLAEWLNTLVMDDGIAPMAPSDTLDLIETNDPR